VSAAYLYRAPASTIDIVQPPGIGIPPIADMDAHQTIVAAALAAKSSAETPKKARGEARSEFMGCEIRKKWGRLDLLVHSIAFAPKADLQGGLLNCSAEGFATAMDISCQSASCCKA
jgi:enoyl-[acyl-carrier protein] reductase I